MSTQGAPTPTPNPAHASPRSTRRGVHAIDRAAELTITIGGIAVIIAVLGICAYLAAQVLPLFEGGRRGAPVAVQGPPAPRPPAAFRVDEYQCIALALSPEGLLRAVNLADGSELASLPLATQDAAVTALSYEPITGRVAAGLSTGQVILGSVRFDAEMLGADDITPALKALAPGASLAEPRSDDRPLGAVVQRANLEQFRRVFAVAELRPPADIKGAGSPIHALDYRETSGQELLVALRADGQAVLELVTTIRPLGGGPPRSRLDEYDLPFKPPAGRPLPDWLTVTGDGRSVLALWKDGLCQRYTAQNPDTHPLRFAEEVALLPPGRSITTTSMLLGGLTVLIGDDAGFLTRAFVAVDPAGPTPDGQRLVVASSDKVGEGALLSITTSIRDRCIAVVDAAGRLGVTNTISEKWVLPMKALETGPILTATLAPKLDGFVTLAPSGALARFPLEKGFPEAGFNSLFGKVQYEGLLKPEHVYQASTGEDTAEVKFGLIPLVQGTLKATAFAMTFAVPLAVLAAVYTSEFLSKRTRRIVKPTIEMMASLPSVVLGFIAAIVLAPLVTEHLSAVLLLFFSLPTGMLLGGFAWQLIPRAAVRKIPPLAKLAAMVAVFGGGMLVAWRLGPAVESTLFRPTDPDRWVLAGLHTPADPAAIPTWASHRKTLDSTEQRALRTAGLYFIDGAVVVPKAPASDADRAALAASPAVRLLESGSIRGWLDGTFGSPFPGWFLVLLTPALVGAAFGLRVTAGPAIDHWVERSPPSRGAAIEFLRFLGLLAGAVVLAFLAARTLSLLGVDARDSLLGSYSQRNTLVVGLIMGFAIIPIIYTIAEDAMSAVPPSLRSASLGAGATPWQTATRVVMPVAASGIFSAVMIGLGRAVGETMIVVMATGNTPDMSWNMFSGCRTLSANIATELPEAAQGDMHFRVLFLCGLLLFAMTFALNTTAEIVRQRFRKRSAAL